MMTVRKVYDEDQVACSWFDASMSRLSEHVFHRKQLDIYDGKD